ncbi:DUF4870 domain-containing protein [Gracilibacillus caseinilyticus]|uniref:DUF4870 domain-containing protein n=1 Tax=Gracilibacillus caseinilyticus TaxID=2932256 RepID=A0ABY4ERN6_9BACI|nr:DUF4870 domain-containing protein [Gracilibacillus caseinilyticus]UOQ47010.1 DUF4870 domain-containing protein [Gracilibacillus caseinilyticus]
MSSSDERLFAMLIYLLSFFTTILGPLIIWLMKRDESDFIDYHGKEYFNFFISFSIYGIVSGMLVFVVIGVALLPLIGIAAFVLTIIALIKAYNGEKYSIPLVIHLIK